ncbi:MAG: hypothetical protein ACO1OB_05375 [Archangium sp.]
MFSSVLAALALTVSSAEPSSSKVVDSVLIGLGGVAATAAYTTGAFLTGDNPSGHPLAIVGGAVSLGTVGMSIGLLINRSRKDPGSIVAYILTPLLAGLAGAAIGGLGAHFAARDPGPGRTATHGVVIGLILVDAFVFELARNVD